MTGELYLNGNDAWESYGVELQFGAYAALICPAPAKDYMTNESRTEHGVEYAPGTVLNERTIALPMGIRASDRASFFSQFSKFVNEICNAGDIVIKTKYDSNIYRCKYKSVSAISEYNGRKGTFVLNLVEPNPTDRS